VKVSSRTPASTLVGLGIFLLVTLGTTGVLFSTIAGTQPQNPTRYSALFSDATRLLPGDDVRVAGVRVGRIEKVSLTEEHLARVEFETRGSLTLPSSTTATIRFRDLVGSRYLALAQDLSTKASGTLAPGSTIPMERTEPALDLTTLLDGFQPLFNVLDPSQVNRLAGQLIRTLQGEGGTVASLLASTAGLTDALASRDAVIGRVVDNLNIVLGTVGDRDGELKDLIDQLSRLSTGLASDSEAIGAAVVGIDGLSTSTAGLLAEVRVPLTQDLNSLKVAAGEFAKTRGDLQQLVDRLPIKLNAFTRAGSYGGYLNFFVCSLDITLTLPGMPSVTAPGLKNNEELCQR